jgi:hypothetical protein
MKKVVNINEMIEAIKEKTHWSEAILAIELGVDSKNIIAWKRGRIPRSKNYKRLKELYESLISKEEINKPDENKDSGLGQELLNKLANADERLNKLASEQEVCYKNLAMVNAQITAWNHERHKLIKQLKELVGA